VKAHRFDHNRQWIAPLLVFVVSFIVYWLTAYRTITWWNNAELSLAAILLGVSHPPGSLLAILTGWVVTKLPLGVSDIFALNLYTGFMASLTAAIVSYLALRIAATQESGDRDEIIRVCFAMAAGLIFAFSETVWLYAVKFTPYMLSALMTSIIMWAMWCWWREADNESGVKWLFVIALLFGLDFSIHRTNLLLLPGFIVWIALRRPGLFKSLRIWALSLVGFFGGLSIHLLIMPIAARRPFINFGNPDNWNAFRDYVTLKQYGGGWLVNLYPRKADFFTVQVPDYLDALSANFFTAEGITALPGLLPLILGLAGLVVLWKREKRLAIGTLILFLLASLGAVIYFNTPENFIRAMNRHYLPSFVIFSIWIVYATVSIATYAGKLVSWRRMIAMSVAALLLASSVVYLVVRNYRASDGSDKYFTHDFGNNLMAPLDDNAILIVMGDNDTYSTWFVQRAEGIREDVTILNVGLLNTPWYLKQVIAGDPDLPLLLTDSDIDELSFMSWQDTVIHVAGDCDPEKYRLPSDFLLPDTVAINVPPTIADKYIMVQDQVLLKMIVENSWKRPIYFASTGARQRLPWLAPFLRLEGTVTRLIPVESPPTNTELMRENLFERYQYRGYADEHQVIDNVSRNIATNYYSSFISLAMTHLEAGDAVSCTQTLDVMEKVLPLERLNPPANLAQYVEVIRSKLSGDADPDTNDEE